MARSSAIYVWLGGMRNDIVCATGTVRHEMEALIRKHGAVSQTHNVVMRMGDGNLSPAKHMLVKDFINGEKFK